MTTQKKHAFYPTDEVERELEGIPRGHLSERVNELILKGISAEKQQQIALAYQQFDATLAQPGTRAEDRDPLAKLMSARAFAPGDEVEDFI